MTLAIDPFTEACLEEARLLLLDGNPTTDRLYRFWFHRETGRQVLWPTESAYRAAILRPDRFENGWRVLQIADSPAGAVVAMRGGRRRVVAPPEMFPDDPRCLAPNRGAVLRVHPLTSGESGGFWHIWSAGWQASPPQRLQRFYFRAERGRALDLALRVVDTAPARQTWAFKIQCGRHDSGRRDGALLYLPVETAGSSEWVCDLIKRASELCQDDLPPFVNRVAPGIGHAPDPGGERSFGQALCAAIASVASTASDPEQFVAAAKTAVGELPGMKSRAKWEVAS